MDLTDEIKRVNKRGETALTQIRKHELPAYPHNYELWYVYATGHNQQLNKNINERLKETDTITLDEVDDLYEQHLSGAKMGNRLEELGENISSEVDKISDVLTDGANATSQYSSSLQGAAEVFEGDATPEKLKEVIINLSSATKDSLSRSRELEQMLEESRSHINELQKSLETVRFESLTDELTTLSNRKHFDRAMEQKIEAAASSDEPLTLLMTDIDHFKNFNDEHGHQTGDQVLRLVAMTVKQNVKGQDSACRYGGEEFAVILPSTTLENSRVLAESIRKAVMSKDLVKRTTGEKLGRVTISIGCSQFREGDSVQTMIERADECLYAAKRGGRNLVITEEELEATEAKAS